MKKQYSIMQILRQSESIALILGIMGEQPEITLHALAVAVCKKMDFHDRMKRERISTCVTALRQLSRSNLIHLAHKARKGGKRKPRGTGKALPEVPQLPPNVSALMDLELERVQDQQAMREWNELLSLEHPQGDRIITGRIIRYFIRGGGGLLGAVGISASALHLEARDEWIGWDWELRRQYLEHVVCLSRLLIRPGVNCMNLASRVLGMLNSRVLEDMEAVYGLRPWLMETFVDPAHHDGSCFRAANWKMLGKTKGRGRYDVRREARQSVKDIYVCVLEPDFRDMMGFPLEKEKGVLPVGEGLDDETWARQEFGGAELGDERRTKRLVQIVRDQSRQSTERAVRCVNGRSAEMQAYYRFMEHSDEKAIHMDTLLEAHKEQTIQRMRGYNRILCPQDSTDLNFTNLKNCKGLGLIGTNQHGAQARGMRLHTTIALNSEGLPLGIVRGECQVRKFKAGTHAEKRKARKKQRIEDKESGRWLRSLQTCEDIAARLTEVRIVSVMDREGDIFDLFFHRQQKCAVELLVRASQDRSGEKGRGSMFTQARNAPESGRIKISEIATGKEIDAEQGEITLSVRYCRFRMPIPKGRSSKGLKQIDVWVIHAREYGVPKDEKPIEWFLISTEPVESFGKAVQCLREYMFRWRIEDWHKVLKSGCAAQQIITGNTLTIQRQMAIKMVIAWRILLMTLLARADQPPSVNSLFSDLELRVLTGFAIRDRYNLPSSVKNAFFFSG